MDREKVIKAVEDLLLALGEDVAREGLKDTPRRVADAYAELLAGEGKSAEEHLSKTFESSGGELVVEKDISFSSTCEHHLMPFFGKIAIAYVPDGRVVGISKLVCKEIADTGEAYAADSRRNYALFKTQGSYGGVRSRTYLYDLPRRKKAGQQNGDVFRRGQLPQREKGRGFQADR